MHRKKHIAVCLVLAVCVLLLGAFGLFQLSKLRTYQVFGRIVARVDTPDKIVALTFDDGPTEHTREVLTILHDKQVKATFFVIGSELEKTGDIGKEIVAQGHALGNHSYTHPRFWFKSQSFIDSEIQQTSQLIRETGFTGEITFRPPFGKKLFGLPWYLQKHNITTVMWDVEPDSYGIEKEFLVNYTLTHTKPGSIIILHPFCSSCASRREALPEIIDELRKTGYTFVTIPELLEKI